jgi:hypothetical protein
LKLYHVPWAEKFESSGPKGFFEAGFLIAGFMAAAFHFKPASFNLTAEAFPSSCPCGVFGLEERIFFPRR